MCNLLLVFAFVVSQIIGSISDCPPLEAPPNGVIISEGKCGIQTGNFCKIECHHNCEMIGSQYRTCLPDGTWSGEETMCLDKTVRCRPKLKSPENGFLINKCRRYGGYVCQFGCDYGYALFGSARVFCERKTRKWSASIPICVENSTIETTTEPPKCEDLEAPEEGSISGTCQGATPGSICLFTCEEGFHLKGESVLACNATGEWSTEAPTCHPKRGFKNKCKSLIKPLHGTFKGYCSHGIASKSCKFKCDEGYYLFGEAELFCRSNGHWSGEPPKCLSLKESKESQEIWPPITWSKEVPEKSHVICDYPKVPVGAIVSSCKTELGSKCHFRCRRQRPESLKTLRKLRPQISFHYLCTEKGWISSTGSTDLHACRDNHGSTSLSRSKINDIFNSMLNTLKGRPKTSTN